MSSRRSFPPAWGMLVSGIFRSNRTRWLCLSVSACLAALGAAVAIREMYLQEGESRRLGAEIGNLEHRAAARSKTQETRTEEQATGLDFSTRLPASAQVRDILSEIERSTSVNGVSFGGMQRQDRNAEAGQLGRTDLTLALGGGYPSIKAVVLDVLGRFPYVTLAQWRVRRGTLSTNVEATLVVAVWTAPSPSQPAMPGRR